MNPADVLQGLGRASIAGGIVAAVVWVAMIGLRRRIPAGQRAWIWWLVAAHFALALLPAVPVRQPARLSSPVLETMVSPPRIAAEQTGAMAARVVENASDPRGPRVQEILIGSAWLLWIAGVITAVALRWHALLRLRRAWKAAAPYEPSGEEKALLNGQGVCPAIRVSVAVDVPLTLAGRRPRILLPATCSDMSSESRLLILAHECAHVKRGDLAWSWLAAIVEICFWFHPLARHAVREYGQAREEACDARALRLVPGSLLAYGELLMRFSLVPRSTPMTVSCGSPTRGALLRRLIMLDCTNVPRWGRMIGSLLIALVLLSLIPLRLDARDSDPRPDRPGQTWTKHDSSLPHLGIDRFAYVLVEAGGENMHGTMKVGGGDDDPGRAREAQRALGGPIFWFRMDGKSYGVNDPKTLEQVRAMFDERHGMPDPLAGEYDLALAMFQARIEHLRARMERVEHWMHLEQAQGEIEGQQAGAGRSYRDLAREHERLFDEIRNAEQQVKSAGREIERRGILLEEEGDLWFRARVYDLAKCAIRSGVARSI